MAILLAAVQVAHASDGVAGTRVTERPVYLNGRLVGVFSICVKDERDTYLSGDFYKLVHLRFEEAPLDCDAQLFLKPLASLTRNDGLGNVVLQVQPEDYAAPTLLSDKSITHSNNGAIELSGVATNAFAVQHNVGLTHAGDSTNLTLGLTGAAYTGAGRFEFSGSAAIESGTSSSLLTDANWRRHVADWAADVSVGLGTVWLGGSTLSAYGVTLTSPTGPNRGASTGSRNLEGFAEAPGRLQVRSRGTLLTEIGLPAGHFSIPLSKLGGSGADQGQFELTLVDDAGAVIRSWDTFVPTGARLYRQGETTWGVFAGQVDFDRSARLQSFPRRNIGASATIRRGLRPELSGEASIVASEHATGAGMALDYVPTSWISSSFGVSRLTGASALASGYATVELHGASAGFSATYARQSCSNLFGRRAAAYCGSVQVGAHTSLGSLGQLLLRASSAIGNASEGDNVSFNWRLPSFAGESLSLYGSRFTGTGGSTAIGLQLSMSLGGGQVLTDVSRAGRTPATMTGSWSKAASPDFQHSIMARSDGSTTLLQGSVQYRPWYGMVNGTVQAVSPGGISIALSETGALVLGQGQTLLTPAATSSLAIVKLEGLPQTTIQDGGGRTKAVTNRQGYAALPLALGGDPGYKVAAHELPPGILLAPTLVTAPVEDWTAGYWQPSVRRVHAGWLRLTYPGGNPLPLGTVVRIGDKPPQYVLENGEVFVEDLPDARRDLRAEMPGRTSRCVSTLPESLELARLNEEAATFVCTPPVNL